MNKIAVTGGCGGFGRFVVADLLEHGYEVVILDQKAPTFTTQAEFHQVDISVFPDIVPVIAKCDAIIHLAAQPVPDTNFIAGAARFKNNTVGAFNIFQAAAALEIKRVIWASSETVLGFPFEQNTPKYFPLDENHIAPQNSYALSKLVTENLAQHMSSLYKLTIIGLRYANILYENLDHPDIYASLPNVWQNPSLRKFNLWSYIDARDASRATIAALESPLNKSDNYIICADDTVMNCKTSDLLDTYFHEAKWPKLNNDFQALVSNQKARELLGFRPLVSWRDVL